MLRAAQSISGAQAALTDNLLMLRSNRGSDLTVDGVSPNRLYVRGSMVTEVHVSRDYFKVMGIAMIRGTGFLPIEDGDDAEAIVADRMARQSGVDPLGRELVPSRKEDHRRYRIVGIVSDTHDRAPDLDTMSTVYLPFKADGPATLVVRSDNPVAMIGPVRQAIHSAAPAAVVDTIRPLDELVTQSLAERRFNAFLYGAFSISGLALSMIGIYGVVAFAVGHRTREIGIRIALGATPRRVVGLVTLRTSVVVAAGMLLGFGGLAALRQVLRGLVYGVQPTDPTTLAGAAILILCAATAAAYFPARRATRVDPMVALRAE